MSGRTSSSGAVAGPRVAGFDAVCLLAAVVSAVSLFLPLSEKLAWTDAARFIAGPGAVVIGALWIALLKPSRALCAAIAGLASLVGCVVLVRAVHDPSVVGIAGAGYWGAVIGLWLLVWRAMERAAALSPAVTVLAWAVGLLVPAMFGAWLLVLWEAIVTGFGVPQVLLPAPSMIGGVMTEAAGMLAADFNQTFVRSVLPGYVMGCASGFLVALLADRVPFFQRGLVPIGNLVSALPIVGIAPIMVMWFGFDWQSKAAVVVVMTFFPMLVNTLAGLAATSRIERDLMRSYGATYRQTALKVRLPNALPFMFNALKINSTLALIGAIVAEFFGTPIVGMGFRISTEVGRMNIDMVWATIAVAAVVGSSFYGALALLERHATGWHPSFRHA